MAEPRIPTLASNITHKPMSIAFLESVSYWTGVAAVAFTAAAAVTGCFAWYFSDKLAKTKDAEFRRFRETSQAAISESQARSAEANAQAAEANKIAEGEKLARVKLEARLAPRSLKGDSQVAVANAIKQFAPQKYDILWYPDDPESANLANDIYGAFEMAGWVRDSSGSFLGFSVTLGVVISFSPSQADMAGVTCNALAVALEKEGVSATSQPRTDDDSEKQPETIKIRVGKKP